jgi:exopolysaccharide production protein ExoZ
MATHVDNKLYGIQYLRGLAALLVVIAHASAHPLAEPMWWQLRLGQFGVYLFFVISGFIMVAISGTGTFAPLVFLKRRAVRIVPLYWFYTTIAALLALALPSLFKSTVFTLPHYVQSLLFIPHQAPGRGGTSPLLSLGWTLNYEVFFYICFALLAVLAATRRVLVLSLVFSAMVIVGLVLQPADPVLQFYLNAAVLAFAAGAWIGLLFLRGGIARLPEWCVPLLLLAAIAAGLVAFGLDQTAGETAASFSALVILGSALVLLALRHERTLPRSGLLERLGDASYSTYLVHMFVIGGVTEIGSRLLAGDTGHAATVATAIAGSLVAGMVSHRFIEQPMLGWFKRRPAPRAAIATPAE